MRSTGERSGLLRLRQPTIDGGIPGHYLAAVHAQRFFEKGLESIASMVRREIRVPAGIVTYAKCLHAGMLRRLRFAGKRIRRQVWLVTRCPFGMVVLIGV
jgi:hypothetical protein